MVSELKKPLGREKRVFCCSIPVYIPGMDEKGGGVGGSWDGGSRSCDRKGGLEP